MKTLEGISKPKSVVAAFARTRIFPTFDRTLASAATVLKPLLVSLFCLPVVGLVGISEIRAEVAKTLTIELGIPAPRL